jgi:ATP-dependent DNA ligase
METTAVPASIGDPPWDLPVTPPIAPMLATLAGDSVPSDPGLAYEPKWDGFRAIAFRSGDRVCLQGRGGDDLAYAFPEVISALRRALPDRIVLDGEVVIVRHGLLDFPALGTRLRPRSESASILRLADETPAIFIAFDILALGDRSLIDERYADRRAALEGLAWESPGVRLTPMTSDHAEAVRWFHEFEGGGLEGLIAKATDAPYQPGKRTLLKVKHRRTLDAVVAGWRPHAKNPDEVASLLLGLYDDHGRLHHVGAASGFSAARRREVTENLRPVRLDDDADHPWRGEDEDVRRPGGVNRWNRGRAQAWHALTPVQVAEVAYDQFEGNRLRHVATWLRWRPDRSPESCTYDQRPIDSLIDISAVLGIPGA